MNFPEALIELQKNENGILESYSELIRFKEGECIFRAGSTGDCCYVIESGEVRLELNGDDCDIDGVLSYLRPGAILGELSLLNREDRSASAFAHTDVVLKKISEAALEELCKQFPTAGLAIFKALVKDTAANLRHTTPGLAEIIGQDDAAEAEIQKMIEASIKAQRNFRNWSEEKLDTLLNHLADQFTRNAEGLAAAAVQETKLGNLHHKAEKNRFAARHAVESAQNCGRFLFTNEAEICSPCGVIVVLVPATSPAAAIIWTSLLALKARNSLIYVLPRAAKLSALQTLSILQNAAMKAGTPNGLFQIAGDNHNWKAVSQLLSHNDISRIVAFGSGELVRAANNSGKPVIGISGGAAPVWICEDADLDFAAKTIISSKSFDHGLMPGAESCLIVHAKVREKLIERLEYHGAAVLTRAEEYLFSTQVIDAAERKFKRMLIGQDAKSIARSSGISRNHPIQLVVVPRSFNYPDHPYCREIPAPIVSLFTADTDEEALLLFRILQMDAPASQIAYAYTFDSTRIRRLGTETSALRISVNAPATTLNQHPDPRKLPEMINTAASSILSLKDFCRISKVVALSAAPGLPQPQTSRYVWPVI